MGAFPVQLQRQLNFQVPQKSQSLDLSHRADRLLVWLLLLAERVKASCAKRVFIPKRTRKPRVLTTVKKVAKYLCVARAPEFKSGKIPEMMSAVRSATTFLALGMIGVFVNLPAVTFAIMLPLSR